MKKAILVLATVISGCANNPLFNSWEFHEETIARGRAVREENVRYMKAALDSDPKLKKKLESAHTDDVVLVEVYDRNGNLVGTAVGR